MPPLTNHAGKTFGEWTVLERAPTREGTGQTRWKCRCSCGRVEDVMAINLVALRSTQCTSCRSRKWFDDKRLKRLRLSGKTWPEIARRMGVSARTLQRQKKVKFSRSRYSGWMIQNFDQVHKARMIGVPWVTIATWSPLGRTALVTAYSRELARRLADEMLEQKPIEDVKKLTAQGVSAAAIADMRGCAERTVVRYRSTPLTPLPVIDIDRIHRLMGRGLDWGEINRRLGKPFEYGSELCVYFNATLDGQIDA